MTLVHLEKDLKKKEGVELKEKFSYQLASRIGHVKEVDRLAS